VVPAAFPSPPLDREIARAYALRMPPGSEGRMLVGVGMYAPSLGALECLRPTQSPFAVEGYGGAKFGGRGGGRCCAALSHCSACGNPIMSEEAQFGKPLTGSQTQRQSRGRLQPLSQSRRRSVRPFTFRLAGCARVPAQGEICTVAVGGPCAEPAL
jgi:hypothetical protein